MTGRKLPVFISWSGEPSKSIALALHAWLPDVLHNVQPWVSEEIGSGRRWGLALDEALGKPGFGILCVTPTNTEAPWLLYEAGALSNTLGRDSRVCPYLVGLSDTDVPAGPLGRFQMVEATKKGTLKLLVGVNEELGPDARADERLRRSFDRFWPDLEKQLSDATAKGLPGPPRRDERDLLEEVLTGTRTLLRSVEGEGSVRERIAWHRGFYADNKHVRALVLRTIDELIDNGARRFQSQWLVGLLPVSPNLTRQVLLDLAREGAWEYSGGPDDDFDEQLVFNEETAGIVRHAIDASASAPDR